MGEGHHRKENGEILEMTPDDDSIDCFIYCKRKYISIIFLQNVICQGIMFLRNLAFSSCVIEQSLLIQQIRCSKCVCMLLRNLREVDSHVKMKCMKTQAKSIIVIGMFSKY